MNFILNNCFFSVSRTIVFSIHWYIKSRWKPTKTQQSRRAKWLNKNLSINHNLRWTRSWQPAVNQVMTEVSQPAVNQVMTEVSHLRWTRWWPSYHNLRWTRSWPSYHNHAAAMAAWETWRKFNKDLRYCEKYQNNGQNNRWEWKLTTIHIFQTANALKQTKCQLSKWYIM